MKIAFAGRSGPGYDVKVYDLASGQVHQVTFGEGSNESPAFSPNGRHIAFTSTRAGKKQIFTIARTGKDAVERCKERVFDAVTLDLLLPDMSGVDVLESLRVGGWLQDTPVIVVTIVPDVKIAGFTISGILRKPLDRDALLRTLERAGVHPGSNEVRVGVDS